MSVAPFVALIVASLALLAAVAVLVARSRRLEARIAAADSANRSADERWRSTLAVSGGVLIGVRPDFSIFEWNREAELLFGLTRVQVLGQDFLRAAVPHDGRDEVANELARAFAGETIDERERYVTDARGRPRLLRWHVGHVRGAQGETEGVMVSGLDVTEWQAAAKRFALLFEHSSDAHVLFDASGVIDCNQAALRLLGAREKLQLAGAHPLELAPAVQPSGLQSKESAFMAEALARRQGSHRFDWTLQTFEGHAVPVEMTLTPVPFEGTEVMLAVLHDLSRRRAAEDAERRTRVQLLNAIDAVDSGFAMFDADERLVLCNAPYRTMLDLDPSQLRAGESLEDILRAALAPRGRGAVAPAEGSGADIPPSDPFALGELLQRHRHPGPSFDAQFGERTQRVSVQRTQDDGRVVTHTDVTTIVRAREEMEGARRIAEQSRAHADQANRAKSTFLAAISHELRTPLHTIIGLTRQLRRNVAGAMRPADLQYLERVEWNGRHLLSLMDNLLDLTKIETGKVQATRAPIDLEACVRATIAQLADDDATHPAVVRVEVPSPLHPLVSDAPKLQLLLRHLVGHVALQARCSGHVVSITLLGDEIGMPSALVFGRDAPSTSAIGAQGESGDELARLATSGRDQSHLDLVMVRALCTLIGATLDADAFANDPLACRVTFRTDAPKSAAGPMYVGSPEGARTGR